MTISSGGSSQPSVTTTYLTSQTVTIPTWAVTVDLFLYAGGCSGGNGQITAVGTSSSGGGGSASGVRVVQYGIPVSLLGTTLTLTVGAGGAVPSGAGAAGIKGGNTSVVGSTGYAVPIAYTAGDAAAGGVSNGNSNGGNSSSPSGADQYNHGPGATQQPYGGPGGGNGTNGAAGAAGGTNDNNSPLLLSGTGAGSGGGVTTAATSVLGGGGSLIPGTTTQTASGVTPTYIGPCAQGGTGGNGGTTTVAAVNGTAGSGYGASGGGGGSGVTTGPNGTSGFQYGLGGIGNPGAIIITFHP